jgi:hypothetical protein
MRRFITTAALIATASVLTTAFAQAKPRRAPNEIVVKGRSFLDAGTKVKPGGAALNYVYIGQGSLATPPYSNISSRYGAETLPRRFELPYR